MSALRDQRRIEIQKISSEIESEIESVRALHTLNANVRADIAAVQVRIAYIRTALSLSFLVSFSARLIVS